MFLLLKHCWYSIRGWYEISSIQYLLQNMNIYNYQHVENSSWRYMITMLEILSYFFRNVWVHIIAMTVSKKIGVVSLAVTKTLLCSHWTENQMLITLEIMNAQVSGDGSAPLVIWLSEGIFIRFFQSRI